MSPNSPGGWGPPPGPPPGPQGPWGPPPPGGPGPGPPAWGNPQGGGYGPPQGGGYGPPAPYGQQPYGGNPYGPPASPGFAGYQSSSDTTTWALVMSILSWFTCGCLLSIPAFFMARSELAAIDRGEVGANNRGNAQAAYWLAAINAGVCLLGIGMYLLFILFAIGVAGAPR